MNWHNERKLRHVHDHVIQWSLMRNWDDCCKAGLLPRFSFCPLILHIWAWLCCQIVARGKQGKSWTLTETFSTWRRIIIFTWDSTLSPCWLLQDFNTKVMEEFAQRKNHSAAFLFKWTSALVSESLFFSSCFCGTGPCIGHIFVLDWFYRCPWLTIKLSNSDWYVIEQSCGLQWCWDLGCLRMTL